MPTRQKDEPRDEFLSRCMSDDKMLEEFSDSSQRYAVCNSYADETVEALQYGRPPKNDPRKTPAKPSERRKGSKKNKPDSASKPNSSIKISKETEKTLQSMMREHNEKVESKGKGSKASMGMLKSVYRRGAGAFSRSHHPSMSRGGWGIARVKAFLYLLRNGRPSNPNYKQDNDLLPRNHSRSTKKAGEDMIEEYEDWEETEIEAAEYQGKKVTLNKPFRTPKAARKFAVYVKNEKGNVVIVRFGDPNMSIKRDDPNRLKNFRSRHRCDSDPAKRWTPRYWSCKFWERNKSVTDLLSEDFNKTEEASVSNMGCGCGCNSCEEAEIAEAKMEDYIFMDREGAVRKSQEIGFDGKVHTSTTADGGTLYFPAETEDEFIEWYRMNDPDAERELSSEEVMPYYFTTIEEAETAAEEMGCSGHHTIERDGQTLYMPCSSHERFMEIEEEDEVDASYHMSRECGEGYRRDGDRCVKVAFEIEIDDVSVDESLIEASTGRQVIRISGVAFHEGINKNGWEITRKGADLAVSQMVGADLTLNHPPSESGSFKRNMDGGVNDAVVGIITEASVEDKSEGSWDVRFKADVYRTELFEALESGLWLRKGYGVSIGGSGIPDDIIEAEDGKMRMVFESDFEFDHLAIVHKPAYNRANIETIEKVTLEVATTEVFNNQQDSVIKQAKVNKMTEEQIIEASEVVEDNTPDYASEIEALKASLAERDAELSAIKAAEEAKKEEIRTGLVAKAIEMGIAGVEDLPSPTLESIIASFEAKVVKEKEVEMKPVVASESTPTVKQSTEVVANFLNGRKVETPSSIYEKAYNAWASAWNRSYTEKDLKAPLYAEAKDRGLI